MIFHRFALLFSVVIAIAAVLLQWNMAIGFDALDVRWWTWLVKAIYATGGLPSELTHPLWWTGAALIIAWGTLVFFAMRPSTKTLGDGADARNTHGSARWAVWRDVVKSGLLAKHGAVVGGFKRRFGVRLLRHDGPEHIMAFAPTRSGKGVALVVPTLLSWMESVLVLDIKGENYAFTAGWRKLIGQRVLRFDPSNLKNKVRYNPLAEVRIGTDHEIADCQNIAAMIIDPDGKGLQDFWKEGGWEWLVALVLHVIYRVRRNDGRLANLADVRSFMASGGDDSDEELENAADAFNRVLNDMIAFDHGRDSVNREVHDAAREMFKTPDATRGGLHKTAKTTLALYADPIVSRNISASDFRISDLMNGDRPTSLYIVIPPSDIQRLRPLIRLLINQFLTRLTSEMEFENGATKKHYKYRLLLMFDEFTSIGKLEIFEKALAFMAGYGLKAYIIIQDRVQLQKEYGKEETITSNCHVKIAYAPNNVDTAKYLETLSGKTTLVQRKRSRSHGRGGSVSDSISEVARPLMTADETMAMPFIRKGWFNRVIPGDMLIYVAGYRPIYGRQVLYFQDKIFKNRAAIEPPTADASKTITHTPATPVVASLSYEAALQHVEKAEL